MDSKRTASLTAPAETAFFSRINKTTNSTGADRVLHAQVIKETQTQTIHSQRGVHALSAANQNRGNAFQQAWMQLITCQVTDKQAHHPVCDKHWMRATDGWHC